MEQWNEIYGPENVGRICRAGKCRTGICRNGKCRTGPENAGRICGDGKCRTGKCRTKNGGPKNKPKTKKLV